MNPLLGAYVVVDHHLVVLLVADGVRILEPVVVRVFVRRDHDRSGQVVNHPNRQVIATEQPLNVVFVLHALLVRIHVFHGETSLANHLRIHLVLHHAKNKRRVRIFLAAEDVADVLLELADVLRLAHRERVVVLRNLRFGGREGIDIHGDLITQPRSIRCTFSPRVYSFTFRRLKPKQPERRKRMAQRVWVCMLA